MKCYRCDNDQELSAKKIDKHGNITFICKPCRRAEYHKTKTPRTKQEYPTNIKEWTTMVKEKHTRIAAKYRDEDFMRAKGLL